MTKSIEPYDIEEIKDLEEKFLNSTEKRNYALALREIIFDEGYDDLPPLEKENVQLLMEMLRIIGNPVTKESYERFVYLLVQKRELINKFNEDD